MRALIVAAALMLTFCSTTTVHVGVPKQQAPELSVPDPAFGNGDPAAGRKAFVATGCTECHRVVNDADLPPAAHAAAGPLLHGLGRYAPNQLAQRITSANAGSGLAVEGVTMRACAKEVTKQQLVDLIAYLRTTGS